jgi:DNA-binding FadR family transcriptional regulator
MSTVEDAGVGGLRRVRRAYEQVADQLREMILSGALATGDRLPSEHDLASRFHTSRSTIREALRLLSSESLIVTRPGVRGGSTIAEPDMGAISSSIHSYLSLLVRSSELTVEELVQSRRVIEGPAASLAASARSTEHLDTMLGLLPTDLGLNSADLFEVNLSFHETILFASGNRLFPLIMRPVFQVMASSRIQRDKATAESRRRVLDHHKRIFDAIAAGDTVAAGEAMARHLDDTEKTYRELTHSRQC